MVTWTQFRSSLKLIFASLGGPGLFLSAFIDSSFLPLPLVSDLLLMELSSRHPMRMMYYVAMAALGSLGGCVCIYWIARKGGQTYYRKHQHRSSGKIRTFVTRHPWASVLLPALAPFPVPFKPFVIAQGVFQVPFLPFLVGTLVGRGLLFLFEGYLGARYGEAAKQFILNQKWASLALFLALILIFFLLHRAGASRRAQYSQSG